MMAQNTETNREPTEGRAGFGLLNFLSEEGREQYYKWRLFILIYGAIYSIVTIFWLKELGKYGMFPFLMLIAATLFFPLSAIAYVAFQSEREIRNLQKEFRLLGLLDEEGNHGLHTANGISREHAVVERYHLTHTPSNFATQSALPVLLTCFGIGLFFIVPTEFGNTLSLDDSNSGVAMMALRYGFLGAYVYCVQLIYRRYATLDLQPGTYMQCSITLAAGFAFNYVAFTAVTRLSSGDMAQGIGAGIVGILAFCLGYFPGLAIRWFNRVAFELLRGPSRQSDALPLSMIDGLSELHEVRLRDEGIDNVQNLATAQIEELLLNTRFNALQLIDWIDQAILHLHTPQEQVESFRRSGVRSISDFRALWEPHLFSHSPPNAVSVVSLVEDSNVNGRRSMRNEVASRLQSTPEQLDILYLTSSNTPNIFLVNYPRMISELSNLRAQLEKAKQEQQAVASTAFPKLLTYIGGLKGYEEFSDDLADVFKSVWLEYPKDYDAGGEKEQYPRELARWYRKLADTTDDVELRRTYLEKANQCYGFIVLAEEQSDEEIAQFQRLFGQMADLAPNQRTVEHTVDIKSSTTIIEGGSS